MELKIVTKTGLTVTGKESTLSDPVANDLAVISAEKQQIIDNYRDEIKEAPELAINYNDAGSSYYLVGKEGGGGKHTFDVVGGEFAEFKLGEISREQADQEISLGYATVGTSSHYAIGGNFSVERLAADGKVVAVWIPVDKK
ncbi:hypothetical protein [Lentilactobacillus sp. Marseille-Q4993]|uniref:hypothetical protein n=1 Tax=Lentilactobacillus sp. Marseille-Q4993 TaxID=3039492 RepID=UPI0024BC289A|nr:hypothetical protein [Lentilactobacillus sp. Marseille-Q4993]